MGKCVLLSNGCKKSNESGDGGTRRVDTAEQYHKENEGSKEKWTNDATSQGNDESDDYESSVSWTRGHLPGVPLPVLVLHRAGARGNGDVTQRLCGVHNRARGPKEHRRIWRTPLVKQMELVTVDGILEHSILPVFLSQVIVLDEVGDRLASVLDLLVPVAKGSECDGVDSLVDGVGAVVPVQQSGYALMPGG